MMGDRSPESDPRTEAARELEAARLADLLDTPLFGRTPTKLRILHALDERRATAAELARQLSLDPAGVHRHLRSLAEAGYIERVETERKWVYHDLTPKGRALVRLGSGAFLLLVLSGGLGAIAFTLLQSLRPIREVPPGRGSSLPPELLTQPAPWLAVAALVATMAAFLLLHRMLRARHPA